MECEPGKDESMSMAVVQAVSAIEGKDPLALPPLADVINTDALDTLFDAGGEDVPRTGGRLSFVYSRCRITVEDGERVTLHPLDFELHDPNLDTEDGAAE